MYQANLTLFEVEKRIAPPLKSAYCTGCEKTWHGANAQAVGFKHAKHYGHKVLCDVTLSFVYDGRPESERSEDPGSD